MWLAIEVRGGAGVRAWPVGDDAAPGAAFEAPDLPGALARPAERPSHVVLDGAVGAMLAGVLVGAEAAAGLKLGRLGGPVALVGSADPHGALMA